MIAVVETPNFINKFYNDFRLYLEASIGNIPNLLVTNEHLFFSMLGRNRLFHHKVVSPTIMKMFDVVPTEVVLAQDVVDGMP